VNEMKEAQTGDIFEDCNARIIFGIPLCKKPIPTLVRYNKNDTQNQDNDDLQ